MFKKILKRGFFQLDRITQKSSLWVKIFLITKKSGLFIMNKENFQFGEKKPYFLKQNESGVNESTTHPLSDSSNFSTEHYSQNQGYYQNQHLNPQNIYSYDQAYPPVLNESSSSQTRSRINFSLLGGIQKGFHFLITSPFLSGFLLGQISMFIILSSFAQQTNHYFLRALGLD